MAKHISNKFSVDSSIFELSMFLVGHVATNISKNYLRIFML